MTGTIAQIRPGRNLAVQDINSSGDVASEESDGNQGSLSTPSTSVAASEAGYSTLDQNKHDTPNTSPPNRNIVLLTPGKRTCGCKGGNCEGLTPNPLTDGDKKDPWHVQKAEAYDKKENGKKHTGNADKDATPLLELTKKGSSSAVEGKSASKHFAKRRRCSPPLPAVQNQNLDNQAATSPLPLKQAQEHGDESQVEEPEWEIKKILARRKTLSGSEYKVQWKDTWLPKSGLGKAQKLLRGFEARIYKV
ncbi:hypothetical protein MMC17_010112 [Xylographa soralifera]|nr:hypothetical protein [Xylographa soralifera]